MKVYIECPLEAALAAKNFGMKFYVRFPKYNCPFSGVCMEGDDVCDVESAIKYIEESLNSYKIYLCEESLPLLEPMEDDIVSFFNHRNNRIYGTVLNTERKLRIHISSELRWKSTTRDLKIIQRNGKPFPIIQYEESDES